LSSSTEDRFPVGRIGRPQGVGGEVTVLVEADNTEQFYSGALMRAGEFALEIVSARPYRDQGLIVAFVGVSDRDAAEALRGKVLTVAIAQRRQLEDGEFWPDQLKGLEAVDTSGKPLGIVIDVAFGPGQDRLVVSTPDGTLVEVPFVDELVSDPREGRIVIDAPEGMF
jgi:16S rRNA processing protein RimM